MVATVPVHHETTLYQSWGDWFAWLNIAFVAGLFIRIVMKRPKERRPIPRFVEKGSAVDTEGDPDPIQR